MRDARRATKMGRTEHSRGFFFFLLGLLSFFFFFWCDISSLHTHPPPTLFLPLSHPIQNLLSATIPIVFMFPENQTPSCFRGWGGGGGKPPHVLFSPWLRLAPSITPHHTTIHHITSHYVHHITLPLGGEARCNTFLETLGIAT